MGDYLQEGKLALKLNNRIQQFYNLQKCVKQVIILQIKQSLYFTCNLKISLL